MRKLAIMIISLLVTAALIIGTPPAQAEPDPPPPSEQAEPQDPRAAANPRKYIHPTGAVRQKIIRGAWTKAANGNKGWLNYKIAKRKFGKYYQGRRKFAAGWQMSGHRVLKMTAYERKKMNQIIRRTRSAQAEPQASPRCRGQNGWDYHNGWALQVWVALNSCHTQNLITDYDQCAIIGGGVLAAVPEAKVKFMGGAIATACGLATKQIRNARANSSKNAIVLRFAVVKWPTPVQVWAWPYPQR